MVDLVVTIVVVVVEVVVVVVVVVIVVVIGSTVGEKMTEVDPASVEDFMEVLISSTGSSSSSSSLMQRFKMTDGIDLKDADLLLQLLPQFCSGDESSQFAPV